MESIEDRRKKILKLREDGKSYGEISKELNESKSYVAFVCKQSKNDFEKTKKKKKSKKDYELIVCSIVSECFNINQVCKRLFLKSTKTNYNRIEKIIKKYNIDTSHFKEISDSNKTNRELNKEEIFIENSQVQTSRIRNYLFKFNLKEKKCECCGNIEWMGKEIPLQVHHINGNNTDNRVENLQILCPNCHAFTDNYCGHKVNVNNLYINKANICPVCKKEFKGKNTFCSKECYYEYKKQKREEKGKLTPTKEDILIAAKEEKTMKDIEKRFGMGDNGIRKWCDKYGLPRKIKELKKIAENILF